VSVEHCLGCVRIVENWDRRERRTTNEKQRDWFVLDVIHLNLF